MAIRSRYNLQCVWDCSMSNQNRLQGDFSGLLQPNSGVTAMKLYRSTFFSVTSMFPDSLMVLDGPSNPEFIIDKMSGPRKVHAW